MSDGLRSCDVFLDANLTKQLNKQSSCRWFETPWLLCDATVKIYPKYMRNNVFWIYKSGITEVIISNPLY